jgi:hypothetical protein
MLVDLMVNDYQRDVRRRSRLDKLEGGEILSSKEGSRSGERQDLPGGCAGRSYEASKWSKKLRGWEDVPKPESSSKTKSGIGNKRGDRGDVGTAGVCKKRCQKSRLRQATRSLSFAFRFPKLLDVCGAGYDGRGSKMECCWVFW